MALFYLPIAVRKPPKIYFFDNGDIIGDESARFENLVADGYLHDIHNKSLSNILERLFLKIKKL